MQDPYFNHTLTGMHKRRMESTYPELDFELPACRQAKAMYNEMVSFLLDVDLGEKNYTATEMPLANSSSTRD